MGPGSERRPAFIDDVPPPDDGSLEAAREAFRETHDILEVFGGFLAVPPGTMVVQATTLGGLTAKLRRQAAGEQE